MVDRHHEPHTTGRPDSAPAPEDDDARPCLVRLRGRRGGGRSVGRRCFNLLFGALLTLFLVAGLTAGGFLLMLSHGPIPVDALGARIAAALGARLGEPYNVSLARTVVENGDHGPAVTITDFQVRGRSGEVIFEAPRAQVAIDTLGLLTGAVTPRRLDIFDLELKLVVTPDGAVALTAGKEQVPITGPSPAPAPARSDEPAPANAPTPAADARDHAAMRPVADALRRLLALSVGAGSPFAALERFSIQRGRLVVDDRMADRATVFEGLEVAYEKIGDSAKLTVSAAGPNGRWSVTAQANGEATAAGETPRSLDVEIDGLSIGELALVAGWRDPPFDFDMPLAARINLGLGADGALELATGRFDVGSGFFFIKDPDHEPLRVDAMTGGFRWDATSRKFDIQPVRFRSGRTNVSFAGRLTPPEDGVGVWALSLNGGPGTLGSERPGEADIALRASELTLRVDPAARNFSLDRFAIDGAGVAFALNGSGSFAERARRLSLRADAGGTQVNALLRLWPSPIAAHTRAWLLAHQRRGVIQTGVLALDFDEAAFVDIHEHRPVADDAVRLEFSVADGELTFLDGAPPLSALAGKGVVTGRTATFVASAGHMDLGAAGKLNLSEGRFDAPDFARKPLPATVMARASGSLDTLNELLSREALKGYGGFSIDPASVKGQVDGRVTVDLKLGAEAGQDKPDVRVAAQISNFSAEKLLGKERLEQASLAVVADAAGMRATGQGRLMGAATRIELRKPLQGVAEATLGFTLDEAARAKQGWNFGSAITGPIGVKITAPMGLTGAAAEKNRPVVELDLTRTAIAALPPGFSKPAGRAAKASFSVASEGERTSLQNFAFDAGAASAQGSIDLDANGGFLAARMSQLRLSPGDDVRVDAQQTKDLIKVTVRGGTLDARPFIQEYLGGGVAAARGGGSPETRDLDLDLKTNLVTGNNGQTLSNVELRLNRNGGRVRDFKLSGRAGRSPLTGGMVQTQGAPQFFIRSDDGGGLLSFLDLYRRMDGGQLQLVGLASGDQLNGMLTVRNFTLRNEAALRRLVAEGAGAGGGDASPPIDPNAAPFDRLQVSFLRSGSRLTLRDGVIHGPAIGTTLEGVIDFGRDQVALNGTFIPAYGVNNLFAKIPLFGPILGGGSNEGLFAVNFRISGSASAPLLSINPLSAIAPGFLRKIFGAADAASSPRLPEEPRSIVPTR